ncbi:MAG: hypothetical protein PHG14_05925 [Desulfobacter postgatei]|uniref:hypothetical protein n=1 Tax=Desulfobacter postgatei TaxID=2293 RepID=UPI0023F0BCF4|nr:hypothetical protein [Desulfobacter postgatei]MDD4273250.1 hypothetical protein [Desulfobacter postgatei]
MMAEKRKQPNRRKSTDFFGLVFIWMNIAACAGLIAAILIFHRAKPEFETVFDRFYNLQLRRYWDQNYVRFLVDVLGTGTLINAAALLLSRYRGRRSTDHRNLVLFLTILYSLLFVLSKTLL